MAADTDEVPEDDSIEVEPTAGLPAADQGVAPLEGSGREQEGYRLPVILLLSGIVATLIAISTSWSSSDPTLRRLLDGPTNGWIPLLSFALALAVLSRFRRGKWPAILTVALVAFGALSRVVASQALDDFDRTWGWWLGLIGALLLLAAASTAAMIRMGRGRAQPFRLPHSAGQIAGIAALVVATVGLSVLSGLLEVNEEVSWPPSSSAITPDRAAEVTAAFAAEDRDPMDVSLEYAWANAATIEPLADGVEFFPRIVADIEQAESSVHIIMFGWKTGDVGIELASLLESKMAEGVEVRILVDGLGSGPYGGSNEMYQGLADAGAEIVVNDTLPANSGKAEQLSIPESDSGGDEIGRADHRKLYVIDGQVAWTGGAGIEDHFRNGEFHDVMVRVTGDVVRQAQAVFLTSFVSHDAALPSDLESYFPEPVDGGTIPTAVLQTVPGGFSSATQQVREMIDDAEERLEIMNPYLTDGDIIDRIVAAAERGVDVRIVVSEQSNNFAAQLASQHHYPRMLDAGVEIWEYPDAVVHAKIVVADDLVHFGTLNLDAWALYRDFEFAMVAESAETAEVFRQQLIEPDISISRRATKPSAPMRVVNWVFARFTWFL